MYNVTGKVAEEGFIAKPASTKACVLNHHPIQSQDLEGNTVTDAQYVFEGCMNKFVT